MCATLLFVGSISFQTNSRHSITITPLSTHKTIGIEPCPNSRRSTHTHSLLPSWFILIQPSQLSERRSIVTMTSLPSRSFPRVVLRRIGRLAVVGLVLLLSFGTAPPARAADPLVASAADPSSSFDYSVGGMSASNGADFGGALCGDPTGDGSVSLALSVSTYVCMDCIELLVAGCCLCIVVWWWRRWWCGSGGGDITMHIGISMVDGCAGCAGCVCGNSLLVFTMPIIHPMSSRYLLFNSCFLHLPFICRLAERAQAVHPVDSV